MKETVLCLVLVLLVFSCKDMEPKDPMEAKETTEQGILYEEYTGVEPTKPEETEIYQPVPPKVNPYIKNGVPSDAYVLFDGSTFDEWMMVNDSSEVSWNLNDDGSMSVKDKTGDIMTKKNFGDVQLHIEWRSPKEVEREGQNRANSGVFLQGLYEVQILDNNDNDTYVNGQVAAIYKQHVPLVMASVPSGEWNSYDIIYRAPEFNEQGNKTKSATITVLHNGVLVQDHVEIKGTTPYIGWPKNTPHGRGPIRLQDHGDNSRVSFRNIWVREL
ncbi:3-keto-disaccharide hydrolase [Muriicola sp.]|uniref:3-keto-disaccharide hydrolase n=1 Tax=Muriicola sp. TaxID=2020856 RepID=UPI003C76B4DC